MKVFLIGFMGSGKSVVGKKLAKKIGLDFYDLDNVIEQNYKMTIPALFKQFGEKLFRDLETKSLTDKLQSDNFVLSCGGGTPCHNNNMELIKESGISIYIKMSEKALASRLGNSGKKRPLVQNISNEDLPDEIAKMLSKREQYYSQADITIEGLSLDLDLLVNKIKDIS